MHYVIDEYIDKIQKATLHYIITLGLGGGSAFMTRFTLDRFACKAVEFVIFVMPYFTLDCKDGDILHTQTMKYIYLSIYYV